MLFVAVKHYSLDIGHSRTVEHPLIICRMQISDSSYLCLRLNISHRARTVQLREAII